MGVIGNPRTSSRQIAVARATKSKTRATAKRPCGRMGRGRPQLQMRGRHEMRDAADPSYITRGWADFPDVRGGWRASLQARPFAAWKCPSLGRRSMGMVAAGVAVAHNGAMPTRRHTTPLVGGVFPCHLRRHVQQKFSFALIQLRQRFCERSKLVRLFLGGTPKMVVIFRSG
jgi:hypothetical protein